MNLKGLNRFVVTSHFKMEGIHTLRDLLTQNDWMTKIDLKDAYFTVRISQGHRKYRRFSFEGRHYQFTCLPFSLSSAPWVFTKTLKPVAALLREQGVRLVVYLNDMLIMARSREEAQEHTPALTFLLTNLGFIVHAEKSILEPAQQMEFLGMVIDSTSQQLRVPGLKIKKLRQECKAILEAATPPPARTVVGKMNAMVHAIVPTPLFF